MLDILTQFIGIMTYIGVPSIIVLAWLVILIDAYFEGSLGNE